jgi:hypothetical protein
MSRKQAAKRIIKSLDDIKLDMSELYDEVRDGRTELKTAAELANVAGKYLKAEQLQLAREIFVSGSRRLPANENASLLAESA